MIVWNDLQNDARVRNEAETLQTAGYAVTVFAVHALGHQTPAKETLRSGVKVVRVTRNPFRSLRGRAADKSDRGSNTRGPTVRMFGLAFRLLTRGATHGLLLARIVATKPDVVHGHDVNTLPTAWLASVLSRAVLVYDAHEISTDREGYTGFRAVVACVERRLAPRAAGMITTTEIRSKFFARAYGVPRPLVLQNRPRYGSAERSDRIRRELQLLQPWPIVLYQGGLQQGRGLERLIDAALEFPKAYFVLIGAGRIAPLLETKVRGFGLTDRVRFIPTVSLDDLPSYTASADIGVQPLENTCLNHYTTDSNKLFEYMMAGLPVAASDMPEIRRILTTHGFGITFSPSDTNALTAAIGRLLEDEGLRRTYAERACQAASILNWENQEQQLVTLYEQLIRRSARRSSGTQKGRAGRLG